MNISRITLTGADERTDLAGLVDLVARFPAVEIGLLYTVTPEGRPRYPSRAWLTRAAAALTGRCAIHVCGKGARLELRTGDLVDLTRHAPRVQVNGALQVDETEALAKLVGTLITQHNIANVSLLDVQAPNHAILIDASGGRGISPDSWVLPDTEKPIGFAGGMGPANLLAEYRRIAPLAQPGSWSDMEGKLRVDDWFSIELARRCAEIHQTAAGGSFKQAFGSPNRPVNGPLQMSTRHRLSRAHFDLVVDFISALKLSSLDSGIYSMGQNVTLVIMSDALGEIERDQSFGAKIAEACRQIDMTPGKRVDIPSGSSCNAAHIVEMHHADSTVLVAVGGNLGAVQAQVHGGNHTNPVVQERMLRALAFKLGFELVRIHAVNEPDNHPEQAEPGIRKPRP